MSSASSDKLHTPFSHKVFQFFFATHIPATVILDSQALLPKWCYPQAVAAAGKWYCDTFADPLMSKMPVWFKAMIGMELAAELPFFIAALYAFRYRKNWIRIPAIVYASHTVTSLIPILATLFHEAPPDKRWILLSFYTPYLLIPAWVGVHFVRNPVPFPSARDDRGDASAPKSKLC